MNSQPTPKVSIGLAVYNGSEYLREALDSILAQTFTDFELIISDNASTDTTESICREYAARDSRIRYFRNARNIGGANNENLTFRLARGEYFRWAAHDDVLQPRLLEECLRVLESDPGVVLCHTAISVIDGKGNRIGSVSRNHGSSSDAGRRFRAVALARDYCEETYGLIRSSVLRRTRLQLNYTASDRTLISELALYGRFHEVPELLFLKRMHKGNEYLDWRTRMAWFDPSYTGKIFFPFWSQLWDYLLTINRSRASKLTQARCVAVILGPWTLGHAKNLIKDIAVAVQMRVHSSEWRSQRYSKSVNWS